MPAALATKIIERVKSFWVVQITTAEAAHVKIPTRREMYERYKQKVGKDVGWAKFAQIVAEAAAGATEPFRWSEWRPWVNPEESAEDSAFLLRINAVRQAKLGMNLYRHEAKWGRRLRVALEGLHAYGQYKFVMLYSFREVFANYNGKDSDTADLDSLVAYKPWLPENQRAYIRDVAAGDVPYPELDPFYELRDPIDPATIPELQAPIVEDSAEMEYQVRAEVLRLGLNWLLTPRGTFIQDIDPEKRDRLDRILKFWAGEGETTEEAS